MLENQVGLLRAVRGKTQCRQPAELVPQGIGGKVERRLYRSWLASQQFAGGRIGGPHHALEVYHQDTVGERFDHQRIHLALHLHRDLVTARALLLTRQPGRELGRKKRDDEVAGPRQGGLREQLRRIRRLVQRQRQGLRQQQQGATCCGTHGQRQ